LVGGTTPQGRGIASYVIADFDSAVHDRITTEELEQRRTPREIVRNEQLLRSPRSAVTNYVISDFAPGSTGASVPAVMAGKPDFRVGVIHHFRMGYSHRS